MDILLLALIAMLSLVAAGFFLKFILDCVLVFVTGIELLLRLILRR